MNHAYDMYEQQQRSPGSHRHQQQQRDLHRQTSRQFDAYATLPTTLYTQDEPIQYNATRNYDRLNATIHANYPQAQHDFTGASAWNTNPGGFGMNNTLGPLASRMKGQQRGRANLPTDWMQNPQLPALSAFSGLGPNGPSPLGGGLRQDAYEDNDELIPTAIVIKNIPFAVKKEQLVGLMTEMRLPLPYAFNYHFDNGVFRGLAFANFTTAEETAAVIDGLNHFELHGRKLRVEYKKMLPQAERERIEREKRERRGQLQEQHMPSTQTLNTQPSIGSLSSPSPVAGRNPKIGRTIPERQFPPAPPAIQVDLNDPEQLDIYSKLLLFSKTDDQETLVFPPTLEPAQRRIVHTIAHQLDLIHSSFGTGEHRQVHVRKPNANNMSPPIPQLSAQYDGHRRVLNRAATTDFSDVRGPEFFGTLRQQGSGYLGFPDTQGGLMAAQNLRSAKSFAEMRTLTPSPAASNASQFGRFNDYNVSSNNGPGVYGTTAASSSNSILTPTTTGMSSREESLLANGMNGMSLGGGFNTQGSPNRQLRGMVSWERENGGPGPIGGHRSVSTNFEEQSRDRSSGHPSRQPRGPMNGANGFSRPRQNGHHGRGSDELSAQGVDLLVRE